MKITTPNQPAPAGPLLRSARRGLRAFTLIELLVVIVIVAVLSAAGIPALKGIGKSNRISAAERQILDDLSFARLQAINQRTRVYVIFASTNVPQKINLELGGDPRELRDLTNAHRGQFTRYAVLAGRSVGDQPGKNTYRYLTPWKTLPDGMIFAPYKYNFFNEATRATFNEYDRALQYFDTALARIPFPNADSPLRSGFWVPAIVYGPDGRLMSQKDEILALAEGTVSVPTGAGNVRIEMEDPAAPGLLPRNDTNGVYQYVRINWLTGRARMEAPEFQ